jgi:AcrR family transcriptional regulator
MKEQVIATSLKQFLAHGIRNMTMQKLASAMGISTKTMYKFFADKEQLLEECLKVHYSAMDEEMKSISNSSPNPVAFICGIYDKSMELDFGANHLFYHDLNYYYPELQDKVISQMSGHIIDILTGAIKSGIAEGYFLSYLQPAVVLEVLSVLYTSVTRHDTYKKFDIPPRALAGHTIDIYLRGICTEKGLKIINEIKPD